MSRIWLSPPHVTPLERELLLDAIDSNWVAPMGPHVTALEAELAAATGRRRAVALSSGTAALHLALLGLDVGPGDVVLTSTLTFCATANAISYTGAEPVFVDSDASWNIDVNRLAEALESEGDRVAAILPVDLYGIPCDHDAIRRLADAHGVPVLADSAEALGADLGGRPVAANGRAAALSFNGNKIITGSTGGALVTDDDDLADRALHLATQAREPAPHYEHRDIGFNYRLSNLVAAVVRGQLSTLDERVAARRRINQRYRTQLGDHPRITFPSKPTDGDPSWWLTTLTIAGGADGARDAVIAALAAQDIEARPVWKPMHLQPVQEGRRVYGGEVAASLFADGLCLPSGTAMTDEEVDRVASIVWSILGT